MDFYGKAINKQNVNESIKSFQDSVNNSQVHFPDKNKELDLINSLVNIKYEELSELKRGKIAINHTWLPVVQVLMKGGRTLLSYIFLHTRGNYALTEWNCTRGDALQMAQEIWKKVHKEETIENLVDPYIEENSKKQKAKLTLADGREIEVEITEEELKKIQIRKSPYERKFAKKYFYIDESGNMKFNYDDHSLSHTHRENNCNYYNDKEFAEKCARADLLMRKLRKFAIESNPTLESKCPFIIFYRKSDKKLAVAPNLNYDVGVVAFKNQDIAKQALETFESELLWYFTEYLKIYE